MHAHTLDGGVRVRWGKKRHGQRDEQGEYRITPLDRPEHHPGVWGAVCCHQGEQGRVQEEGVLHCTPGDEVEYIYDTIKDIMVLYYVMVSKFD